MAEMTANDARDDGDAVVDALVAPLGSDGDEPAADAVGMIRKATREERRKRSSSYRHTEPYRQVLDRSSGLEFDLRACKYCDAVFSFKGGTTSAALRHLKSAHPQEFFEGGRHERKRPGFCDEGSQVDDNGRASMDEDGKEDGDSLLKISRRSRRSPAKRRRYEEDSLTTTSVPQLTMNQLAISHFLANYKDLVAPSRRFALVKHLAYNDREAAMYNVLDDEMRLEYLAQFNTQDVNSGDGIGQGPGV